ncbi:putative phospholipid-binding protein MlaC precursor [bacterium BMS3Bbin12]|nr:putative phospholipid-binding protein MlaC precursor [bacterium BMS3Abin12]GBE49040.1 putative phospholipid-binding protein MlaC precursor [bacterium BMS3Bbin12]GBE51299.1 putative phospholipid-binding protein MlaC precursor [bacterium BMS3Bbin13]HDJ86283.1 hypothetical protein [Chromatiales bacterium]
MRRTFLRLSLIAVISCAPLGLAGGIAGAAPAQTVAAGPVRVIRQFQDTLITVMKGAATLGYRGRYAKLAPVVTRTHDLTVIARVALGRSWSRLTPAQRAEFLKTFAKLSIATYAARFDGYGGEVFTPPTAHKLPRGDVLVESQLKSPDGSKVQFGYQMRKIDGRWRIVNIIADGVSDLALERAEYSSVIRRYGFNALLTKLKERIAGYARKGAGATAPS